LDKTTVEPSVVGPHGELEETGNTMSTTSHRRNKVKVLAAMTVAVIVGSFGDISLSRGMKMVGAIDPPTLVDAFVCAATNPYVLGGVGLLITFLFLYLASLSWEDLSFVLPLSAADYVLVTLLAYFLLGEDVNHLRWLGSVFVALGVALVART